MDKEVKAVEAALSELGSTSREVANSLRAKGIKGSSLDGCSCPITNLLKPLGITWVGSCYAWFDVNDDNSPTIELPYPVQDFIICFDSGHYYDLHT